MIKLRFLQSRSIVGPSLRRWLLLVACYPMLIGTVFRAAGNEAATSNKALVAASFSQWVENEGTPFDLLEDDAIWTILGPTPTAGTYTIPRLREEIFVPFQARLATPLKPEVHALYQDGETVIALFEARAQLKSGDSYANSYAWFFRFEGGKVRSVVAVLDLSAFDQVVQGAE